MRWDVMLCANVCREVVSTNVCRHVVRDASRVVCMYMCHDLVEHITHFKARNPRVCTLCKHDPKGFVSIGEILVSAITKLDI